MASASSNLLARLTTSALELLSARIPPQLGLRRAEVLIALALVLLVSAIGLLSYSGNMLVQQQAGVAMAQQSLITAQQQESTARTASDLAASTHALLDEATAFGYAAQDWERRRFDLKQVSMSRQALNALLSELHRTPERLFITEFFDLAVKQKDEGLFTTPAETESGVVVSLRGTLMFRMGKNRS